MMNPQNPMRFELRRPAHKRDLSKKKTMESYNNAGVTLTPDEAEEYGILTTRVLGRDVKSAAFSRVVEAVGIEMADARISANLTTAQLAKVCGIEEKTVKEIEQGNCEKYLLRHLSTIALALNKTLELRLV